MDLVNKLWLDYIVFEGPEGPQIKEDDGPPPQRNIIMDLEFLNKKITENTLIPLGLVIVLIGGVVWLTSIKADTLSLKERQEKSEIKQDKYNETLQSIDERLSHMEGILEELRSNP